MSGIGYLCTMKPSTSLEFDQVAGRCRNLYARKNQDYGASWRIMRPSTLTDQLFIKAKRIRTLESGEKPMVDELPDDAFMALVNYGVMALLQLELPPTVVADLEAQRALELYDSKMAELKDLMTRKNHDYGEAWRDMRVSSFTDIILTKLRRIKEIEDHNGLTQVSEGVAGNYMDIVIYAIFALIQLAEK